ncbi:MAG: AMP-binding protein [Bacteroidaceae bacterium]|nr:AMP-binding protein [Bacteroidaceae bacterium]
MTVEEFLAQWNDASPTMEVRTSGSTGTPKLIYIEKERMRASARMTCDFLGLKTADTALLCMPLDYIAGKMMVVRALELNMKLLSVEPSGHPLADNTLSDLNEGIVHLAAMVPLQVWNTLRVPEERERLHHIKHLIIGGGAIPRELEQELRTLPINVWSSYGMTETLSHIALRRISEDYYSPLPGISLSQDQDDCLIINAPALCAQTLYTNDIVRFHGKDHFQIIGRRDNTICSGGIKIQIEQVEAWLQSIGIDNIMVTYREDKALGQALVYLTTDKIDTDMLRKSVPTDTSNSKFWLPRHIVKVPFLPLTPTGKPDRATAKQLAEEQATTQDNRYQ